MVKVNKMLGAIDMVLHEGAIEEADKIVNKGLTMSGTTCGSMRKWQRRCRSWRRKMRFSLSFAGSTRRDRRRCRCRCRCKCRCRNRGRKQSRSGNVQGSIKVRKNCLCIKCK